jgi:hypothetical protein
MEQIIESEEDTKSSKNSLLPVRVCKGPQNAQESVGTLQISVTRGLGLEEGS